MTPRITVGIAFHDEERYLGAAVRSILRQSFEDIEVLLVDDGSTDGSVAVARQLASDERVRLLVDGQHRHLASRLNQMVGIARAPYFARMDADDVSATTRLAKQLALLDTSSDLDAVGSWAAIVDAGSRVLGIAEAHPRQLSPQNVVARGLIPHATMLARTDWLRAHRYDEGLRRAEDRDLWCRVGADGRVDVVPEILYAIRVVVDGASFLPDYRAGQADLRRVITRYGPEQLGWSPTLGLLASSLGKSAAMVVAHRLGLTDAIVRRRGRPPTADEMRATRAILRETHSP